MHWIKERVLEYEDKDISSTETVCRIYVRLRSDGSMWYQVSRRGGVYDRHPDMLEMRFSDFLKLDPAKFGAHSGWTEQNFDEDFTDRLKRMRGKEITPVIN